MMEVLDACVVRFYLPPLSYARLRTAGFSRSEPDGDRKRWPSLPGIDARLSGLR